MMTQYRYAISMAAKAAENLMLAIREAHKESCASELESELLIDVIQQFDLVCRRLDLLKRSADNISTKHDNRNII